MIKPDPPASLADTREIVERMDARGETVTPVDEGQAEAAIRDLVESGVETLTIAFINSYISPRHEEEVARDRRAAVSGLSGHASRRMCCPSSASTSAR